MSEPDLIKTVPEDVRCVIIDALSALSREHSRAYVIACDIASSAGKETPTPEEFRIFKIADIARRFGGAIHG